MAATCRGATASRSTRVPNSMIHTGWMWNTMVATPMEVSGMAAKNSAQFSTMRRPVATTTGQLLPRTRNSRTRPVASPQASSASAPKAQRNSTVTNGCWRASSTNMPTVPSSTPPAIISHWPRVSCAVGAACAGVGAGAVEATDAACKEWVLSCMAAIVSWQ